MLHRKFADCVAHHALLLAGGDAILIGIDPESAIAKATSEWEVIPVRVNGIAFNEERAIGVFASGCAFYEFCNDFFIGHGIQWLLVTLSV
jgi:hypothetical protein